MPAQWHEVKSRAAFLAKSTIAKEGCRIKILWPSKAEPECERDMREGSLHFGPGGPYVILPNGGRVILPPKDFQAFYEKERA